MSNIMLLVLGILITLITTIVIASERDFHVLSKHIPCVFC